jgi:hypothetical protein
MERYHPIDFALRDTKEVQRVLSDILGSGKGNAVQISQAAEFPFAQTCKISSVEGTFCLGPGKRLLQHLPLVMFNSFSGEWVRAIAYLARNPILQRSSLHGTVPREN